MVMKNIGKKIKELRKSRHISQEDLGLALGVSRATVGSWESGRRNISVHHLEQVSRFFKIDISYFREEDTADEIIELIDRARVLFRSEAISMEDKQNLYDELMKLYLQMKG